MANLGKTRDVKGHLEGIKFIKNAEEERGRGRFLDLRPSRTVFFWERRSEEDRFFQSNQQSWWDPISIGSFGLAQEERRFL